MSDINSCSTSLQQALTHIKQVQTDMLEVNKSAMLDIANSLSENIDEHILEAIQHQDIISQQFSATISMMENMNNIFSDYLSGDSIDFIALQKKIEDVVKEAKDQQDRFSGKLAHVIEDIEFF